MNEEDLDLSTCAAVPHPVAKIMGRPVHIGLANSVIDYFDRIGAEVGLPAERVMELYLRHMAYTGYRLSIDMDDMKAGSI
ncbi:hypothetical protein ACLB1G_15355 [Oxalobacteraceae bacterium A2-2]